jgi:hypothetical protein
MTISNELLDELLKGCKRPDDLLSEAGLMKKLKIRLPDQTNRRSAQACSSQTANDVCSGQLIEHHLFTTFAHLKYVKVGKS